MSHALLPAKERLPRQQEAEREFVIMSIAGQQIGIAVEQVEDVLRGRMITPVPLAPREVAGLLNLRGRIVTAIDMRIRLSMEGYGDYSKCMSVVSQVKGQLYSFMVDHVFEVLSLAPGKIEKCPSNMENHWRDVALGVYRRQQELLVLVDAARIVRQQ